MCRSFAAEEIVWQCVLCKILSSLYENVCEQMYTTHGHDPSFENSIGCVQFKSDPLHDCLTTAYDSESCATLG